MKAALPDPMCWAKRVWQNTQCRLEKPYFKAWDLPKETSGGPEDSAGDRTVKQKGLFPLLVNFSGASGWTKLGMFALDVSLIWSNKVIHNFPTVIEVLLYIVFCSCQ